MRRLALVLTAGAVWLFLFAIPVFADNGPHVKGAFNASLSGSCAGCHRAHSGQEPYLLKEPVEDLCYSCHAGAGASTDVKDGRTTTQVPLRGGGFEYALIDTTNSLNSSWQAKKTDSNVYISYIAAQPTNSHHSISGAAVNMWGSGFIDASTGSKTYTVTTNLECTSCHDPHGNGQYRILNPLPGDVTTGTAAVYINDVPFGGNYNYGTLNYGVGTDATTGSAFSESAVNTAANYIAGSASDGSAITYNTTGTKLWKGTYPEASSRWCATCHTRYMGYRGSAGNIVGVTDTGTGDPTFAFIHAIRNIVDPKNPLAPTTGVLTPINTGEGVFPNAQIGCYVSGGFTLRGVAAVKSSDNSAPVADCTQNKSGLLGRSDGRPNDTKLTASSYRCLTCHVSHGSNATDGLGQPYAGGIGQISGETSIVTGAALHSPLLRLDGRAVCQNCHNK